MSQPTPKEKFTFIHPKDENGEEVHFSFMLVLGKQLSYKFSNDPGDTLEHRLIKALGTLDGIDGINPNVGRYTIGATIARTFDPEEVLTELRRRLEEDVLSEIVRPKLVTP